MSKTIRSFKKEFDIMKERIDKIIKELETMSFAVDMIEEEAKTYKEKTYVSKILRRIDKLLSYIKEFKDSWEADEAKEVSKEG